MYDKLRCYGIRTGENTVDITDGTISITAKGKAIKADHVFDLFRKLYSSSNQLLSRLVTANIYLDEEKIEFYTIGDFTPDFFIAVLERPDEFGEVFYLNAVPPTDYDLYTVTKERLCKK